MLTLDQCVDFCGLTDDEVDMLARHHGVPTIVATELGSELLKTREGRAQLACVLRHCANCAVRCGNLEEAARCFQTYTTFRERLAA